MEAGGEPRPMPEEGEAVDPEWRIYARSAGDDKAPIAAILPVLRSFREAGVAPTSNLIFFLDGEEEAGSPHLGEYMERWNDRIEDIDIWLFFDGPAHPSGDLKSFSASGARWGWKSRFMARAGISIRGTKAAGRLIPAIF